MSTNPDPLIAELARLRAVLKEKRAAYEALLGSQEPRSAGTAMFIQNGDDPDAQQAWAQEKSATAAIRANKITIARLAYEMARDEVREKEEEIRVRDQNEQLRLREHEEQKRLREKDEELRQRDKEEKQRLREQDKLQRGLHAAAWASAFFALVAAAATVVQACVAMNPPKPPPQFHSQ